jgi:hypothetical protein
VAYLKLAEGLVIAGAKAKLVERYTHLPHSRVSEIYRAFRGAPPPAGPIMQGSARFFAVPGKNTSEALRIQCSIFLGCYERIGEITTTPLHRGWQLLTAFNAYLGLTEKLSETACVKRLDINQAYALLTFCGFLTPRGQPELQRKECSRCGIRFPVAVNEPLARQGCPVCAMNANCLRLVRQAGDARTR